MRLGENKILGIFGVFSQHMGTGIDFSKLLGILWGRGLPMFWGRDRVWGYFGDGGCPCFGEGTGMELLKFSGILCIRGIPYPR